MSERSQYPLRLARSLAEAARLKAERDGISLNQFISLAIAEKLSRMDASEQFGRTPQHSQSAELKERE